MPGEPLVLIHGFSATRSVWQPLLESLERDHEVLAVNLAGHVGGPEIPDGTDVSVGALVDAVERDMDAAGFEAAHLVGNSLGGWISLELAKRGRARSVVAIAPAGGWEQGTRDEQRLRKLFNRNHQMTTQDAAADREDDAPAAPTPDAALAGRRTRRPDPRRTAAQLIRDSLDCSVYFELMDAILRDGPPQSFDGLSVPVLLVWGTRDRILPPKRYSERLRRMLPDAEWVELKGLGHMPMSDDPELVARTISSFVARAGDRPAVAA